MEYDNRVILGDCLAVLREIPDNTYDSVVTDPPYGLGTKEPTVDELIAYLQGAELDTGGDFMGKKWFVPSVAVWKEVYRVLKPGGHVLSFGGTRTFDLISLGLRAANFEYRDTLQWLHGQGFPKSLNVSAAIDKAAGAEREVLGHKVGKSGENLNQLARPGQGDAEDAKGCGAYGTGAKQTDIEIPVTAPATDDAKKWDGWGTALKPAWEPIVVFRKPLEGSVADNVLAHGTGALNIDATRVYTDWNEADRPDSWKASGHTNKPDAEKIAAPPGQGITTHPGGRWPPNVLTSHADGCKQVGTKKIKQRPVSWDDGVMTTGSVSLGQMASHDQDVPQTRGPSVEETVEAWDCVDGCPVKALDEQSGELKTGGPVDPDRHRETPGGFSGHIGGFPTDYAGGASRFFPQFEGPPFLYTGKATKKEATLDGQIENKHPTKKPLKLMAWLVKLVTQKDGLVLDPYCGSGSTLHAAVAEGLRFTGIDSWDYAHEVATKRMAIVCAAAEDEEGQRDLFELAMGGGFDA